MYMLEMEEVRLNKEWMCPHCMEEKGAKPYWICNRYRVFALPNSTTPAAGLLQFISRDIELES